MKENISRLFCNGTATLNDVLNIFETAAKFNLPSGIALFVDDNNCLIDVISDGDIRRAL